MGTKKKTLAGIAAATVLGTAAIAFVAYYAAAWPRLDPGTEVVVIGDTPQDNTVNMRAKASSALAQSVEVDANGNADGYVAKVGRHATVTSDNEGSVWDGSRWVTVPMGEGWGASAVRRRNLAPVH